jgi:hypothetical protein
VGGTYTTVNLSNTYISPVVVCSLNYNNSTLPTAIRVDNVTATSFDVRLQIAGDVGSVTADEVYYIVMEEGGWTMPDGRKVEAQKYLSTVTSENNSWVDEDQTYLNMYTTPVVLGQVMSENDALWSTFWCSNGSNRSTPPSASGLATGKSVAEDSVTVRADETIGFIVIDAGTGTIDGTLYEAALGGDSIRGIGNSPPYSYTFSQSFTLAPAAAIVTQAAMDGNNGGWAYLYGATPLTATTIRTAIDEDQINDSERSHTTEQVGYLVFEDHVVFEE